MPNYRRIYQAGGCYFFTINLLNRQSDLLVRNIDQLRQSVTKVKEKHPFQVHGWVVLPDHIHCLIELPEGDDNYPLRLRLIKSGFSKTIDRTEPRDAVRIKRGERGIWQKRYWEHFIRDEKDYNLHLDYIHINPLKHEVVNRVKDWPYSTFHRCVESGLYDEDWAGDCELDNYEFE